MSELALPVSRVPRAVVARKLFHMNGGSPAWFIRFMRPSTIIAVTLFLFLLNRYVMPRFANGRRFWHWQRFWREAERAKGTPSGILLYCAAMLVVAVAFRDAKWMIAAIWGVLAYGDGMAEIVGRAVGGPRLPWNARKGWSGSVAFVLFGGVAAAALIAWTLRTPFASALPIAFALSTVCAIAESLPIPVNDNVTVPATGAAALPILILVPSLAIA